MDVIIFGGQSNMQGQTEGLPVVNEPIQGAFEYKVKQNEYVSLQHPVGEDLGENIALAQSFEGGGSLVPAFCRAYVTETGREVAVIHAARGNTSIKEWLKGTERFLYLSEKLCKGIEKAKEKGKIEHIYYVWLQGESDAILGTSEDEYVEMLKAYKNILKQDFGIEKFGIIKVGYFFATSQWHNGVSTYEKKKACDETVMRAQERAVNEDADFIMLTRICVEMSLNPAYINPNASGHYNNAGMELIGAAAGKALALSIGK